MRDTDNLEFAHRLNADGSFDSICLNCFLTIGSSDIEADLLEFEKDHSCNVGSLSTSRARLIADQ
jgi:hypothetical protein